MDLQQIFSLIVSFLASLDWAVVGKTLAKSGFSLLALYGSFRLIRSPFCHWQVALSGGKVVLAGTKEAYEGQAPYICSQREAGITGQPVGLSNAFNFLLNILETKGVEYFSLLRLRMITLHTFVLGGTPNQEMSTLADQTVRFSRAARWNNALLTILVVGYLSLGLLMPNINETVDLVLNIVAMVNFAIRFRPSRNSVKVFYGDKVIFSGSCDCFEGQAPYIALQKHAAAQVKQEQEAEKLEALPTLVNKAGYLLNIKDEDYPVQIHWSGWFLRQVTEAIIKVKTTEELEAEKEVAKKANGNGEKKS